jgi:NDP-sugar pyrophosphorylase family protein
MLVTNRPLLIVGAGVVLRQCAAAWTAAQPERTIRTIETTSHDHFNRDLSPMADFPASEWNAFAALSGDGLSMARLKLFMDIRMKGYKLESFVSPGASVPGGMNLGENSFVAPGAVIEDDVAARYNLCVGARAVVGYGSRLGHSVWIGAGALIGSEVSIGDNCTIGSGAVVANGIQVGKLCELSIAREYRESIESKTFFSPMFDEPVRIYGGRS